MKLRIAGKLPCSLANGEGVRYVVFTQGCAHRCDGCHNPDTWDFNGGVEVSVEELAEDIRRRKYIDGLTLSGGDPFYQQEACVELLKLLPGTDVWIYTGFEYEEIRDTQLAGMADAIVCGRFVPELRCEGKHYGSSNQRIVRREARDFVNRAD